MKKLVSVVIAAEITLAVVGVTSTMFLPRPAPEAPVIFTLEEYVSLTPEQVAERQRQCHELEELRRKLAEIETLRAPQYQFFWMPWSVTRRNQELTTENIGHTKNYIKLNKRYLGCV